MALVGLISPFVRKAGAQDSELRVMCSDGMEAAVTRDLTPGIEHARLGANLSLNSILLRGPVGKIDAGEPFDVAILATANIDDLIKRGKIAADSRVEIGRAGIGIGIRAGAPKPDVSTPEAMKRTLLKAKSVTFNSTGATAALIYKMFDQLGISDDMKPKIVADPVSGSGQKRVADGKVDMILILIPEVKSAFGRR